MCACEEDKREKDLFLVESLNQGLYGLYSNTIVDVWGPKNLDLMTNLQKDEKDRWERT